MRFVAFGDSVMWGQGLRDEDKFVVKASKAIAERAGQAFNRADLTLLAHSGAPITMVGLRKQYSANPQEVYTTEAAAINDFFTEWSFMFPTEAEKTQFKASGLISNDRLNGEVPRDFQTVISQIQSYPANLATAVDVVYVSGGGNDLDFVKYISNHQGTLEGDVKEIQEVLEVKYRLLATEAVQKFPKATIFMIGYYPILSIGSSIGKLKQMAYDVKGISSDKIGVNEWLQSADNLFSFLIKAPLRSWFGSQDVDEYARRAIQFNLNAYYAASVVMRKIVRDLAKENVLFVEPGFGNDSSLFSSNSHIFEGYLDSLSNDAAIPARMAAGTQWLNAFDARYEVSKLAGESLNRKMDIERLEKALQEEASELKKAEIQGKLTSLKAAQAAYEATLGPTRYHFLTGRRHRMPIFSFLHPNEKGANAYYQKIMARHDIMRSKFSLRKSVLVKGGSLKAYLDRFQVKVRSMRAILVDAQLDMVVLRIKARPGFFVGFNNGFVNSVKIHLHEPIDGRETIFIASLTASSFASYYDADTGRPRALDADQNELYGCYPIIASQLDNLIGMEKLVLGNIAAIELQGMQLATVVDSPYMGLLPSGQAPIVLPDAQMVASRIEVFADTVLVATKTPVPLWKKKNGTNPNVRIDVTA